MAETAKPFNENEKDKIKKTHKNIVNFEKYFCFEIKNLNVIHCSNILFINRIISYLRVALD